MLGTSRTFRPAAHAKNRRGIKRHSLRMPGDNYLDTHRILTGIKPETLTEQVQCGRKRTTFRYRWLNDVPLRGNEKSRLVNWFSVEICDARGVVTYRNSFISDLAVRRDNVAAMVAAEAR